MPSTLLIAFRDRTHSIAQDTISGGVRGGDSLLPRQNWIAYFRLANAAHKTIFLNRSAFAITDTENKLIAAAAIMGESSNPKVG